MKKIFLFLVLSLLLVTACNKAKENPSSSIEGNYIGNFERNGNVSNVQLTLANQKFSGESETARFPAICEGNYSVVNGTITFENTCVWTADFDWSLILSGTWSFNLEENVLTMTKSNGDEYILTKQ